MLGRILTVGALLSLVLAVIPSLNAKASWHYSLIVAPDNGAVTVSGQFEIRYGQVASILLSIVNLSDSLVSVLWDDSALVLPDGSSGRLIHTGVRYVEVAKPQAPTPIPPRSRATEAIWPVNQLYQLGSQWEYHRIKLVNECVIKLFLTIEEQIGKHTYEWAWRFQESRPASAPSDQKWFGFPFLVYGKAHTDEHGSISKITGFNVGLGFSNRFFVSPEGLEPNRFNGYWGWGTLALIAPYFELGTSYAIPNYERETCFIISFGLLYILPYIEISFGPLPAKFSQRY